MPKSKPKTIEEILNAGVEFTSLRMYRKLNDISIVEFARRMDMDVSTISKYESGAITPSLAAYAKIHAATNGEVSWKCFLNGK